MSNNETEPKYYEQKPLSGKAPEQMVILLHGLGADGRDLIALAPYFAKSLPNAVFLAPDAPFPCDMAPMGRQWFSLQEWTPEKMLSGAQAVLPALNVFIESQLEKQKVKAENLVLAGFSQGAGMALYAGMRFRKQIAGVLSYSGWLMGEDELDWPGIKKVPVHLLHGSEDAVVPVRAWHQAKKSLEAAGFEVSGEVRPALAHAIDDEGIRSGSAFLQAVFKEKQTR